MPYSCSVQISPEMNYRHANRCKRADISAGINTWEERSSQAFILHAEDASFVSQQALFFIFFQA